MIHALDCGLNCGLMECDCTPRQYKPTCWARMPFGARKSWLRYSRAMPSYDLALTKGWEWFQPIGDPANIYATNRSGHWYVASATRSEQDKAEQAPAS